MPRSDPRQMADLVKYEAKRLEDRFQAAEIQALELEQENGLGWFEAYGVQLAVFCNVNLRAHISPMAQYVRNFVPSAIVVDVEEARPNKPEQLAHLWAPGTHPYRPHEIVEIPTHLRAFDLAWTNNELFPKFAADLGSPAGGGLGLV